MTPKARANAAGSGVGFGEKTISRFIIFESGLFTASAPPNFTEDDSATLVRIINRKGSEKFARGELWRRTNVEPRFSNPKGMA